MKSKMPHKLPRPRLRARKLSIAGKSSFSGGKAPAFHPSGGMPPMAGGGGMPGAAPGGAPGGDQPGAFMPSPPDQAFQGPSGG